MKHECAVVRDLLPLYIDTVCSAESKKMVEEHLLECADCTAALEQMGREVPRDDLPDFSEQEVLKKTAWHISKRAVATAAGITAIVLYWLVYLWQEALAEVGDYRFLSYRFHEVYSIGYLLVPVLTTVWFAVLLARSAKGRAWRVNGALLLILLALCVGQWSFLYGQAQTVGVTCVSRVVAIPDDYHVVIESWQGNVTLETSPTVTRLLETDGTEYVFTYKTTRRNEQAGKLSYASQIDD